MVWIGQKKPIVWFDAGIEILLPSASYWQYFLRRFWSNPLYPESAGSNLTIASRGRDQFPLLMEAVILPRRWGSTTAWETVENSSLSFL